MMVNVENVEGEGDDGKCWAYGDGGGMMVIVDFMEMGEGWWYQMQKKVFNYLEKEQTYGFLKKLYKIMDFWNLKYIF